MKTFAKQDQIVRVTKLRITLSVSKMGKLKNCLTAVGVESRTLQVFRHDRAIFWFAKCGETIGRN